MMDEFLASDTGLIVGILLMLVAVGDYFAMRYIIPHFTKKNPETMKNINQLRRFAPYWIAACTVAGLYLVMQYFKSSQ
jgi:hypothetical protein